MNSPSIISVSYKHLQSALIVEVTRGQSAIIVLGLTLIAVESAPTPKRHINFLLGWGSVPPAFLKLWRGPVDSSLGSSKEDQSGSTVNI